MNSALIQFRENLNRVRAVGGLASAVQALTAPVIDVSDIWRAQIVLTVSALDHFIHELARLGMIEIAKGTRPKTDPYLRFQLPIAAVEGALIGTPHDNWIGETVREKHSFLSFQEPDKLADAIRLISPVKLWEEVGKQIAMPAQDVKIRLRVIVDRRNQIAHEADMDPTNPGFRWQINAPLVNGTIDFIERVGEAIYGVAI